MTELIIANAGEEISSTNVIDVIGKNCKVNQQCKIVAIRGKAEWAGRVNVHENAENADAAQLVRGLPLQGGVVKLKPVLNILNKNVKVKHGAVILQDFGISEKLFLRNRGVPDDQVNDILLAGFISS